MTPRPIRRWLVCLGLMLALVLKATPTAQQCYLDISAYASGVVSGYDASGNGVLDYYGSGFDYSWCEGYQCAHVYAIQGTVRQTSTQAVWDQLQVEGTEFSQSVSVTPGDYQVESLFYVDCTICAQQVFVTQAVQAIEVPQCQVPFLSVKGLSRGRTVLYQTSGGNIAHPSSIGDAFSSWTSRNGSSGVNVTYSAGETSTISGIVVTVGDASAGGENYGKFDATVSDGRILGGSLVISDDTGLVWSGDGYRRITQHELGHAHGLDDYPNSASKGSVMRLPITTNGASLADYVTQCDGLRAYQREDN